MASHCIGVEGTSILDDVVQLMLHPSILGMSSTVHVMTLAEGIVFTSVYNEDGIPWVLLNPNVSDLFIPRATDNNHYILLHVNLEKGFVHMYDSLISELRFATMVSMESILHMNLWGIVKNSIPYHLVPGPQQQAYSNDCAIYMFRNIVLLLTQFHVVPILEGVTITDGSEIDRVCFRQIFDKAFPGMGAVYYM